MLALLHVRVLLRLPQQLRVRDANSVVAQVTPPRLCRLEQFVAVTILNLTLSTGNTQVEALVI